MKTFQDLIERSYTAIRKRGLIYDGIITDEFEKKMKEELKEINDTVNEMDYISEVTDLATVCIMQIKHLGYDFEKEFEKVVIKNETRKD